MLLACIVCEFAPSTYDVVRVVFCVTNWVSVIPVETTIHVFKGVSFFVDVVEFTNCVPFHRNISHTAIDEIDETVSKLWVKFVLAHFKFKLYIILN